MKLVYKGKTKDVYELEDGNYLFKMKDDATGKDGVFDPGENAVGLTIDGMGLASLKMSVYYFDLLNKKGVPTHYISSDIDNATMTVKPAKAFSDGPNVEVICRFKAIGSFYRRYQTHCKEGMPLDALVEVTLKDDERGDPLINKDALAELKIMTPDEYEILKSLAKKIAYIMKEDFAEKGLDLYDMKVEFGRVNGEITLIDEISGGCVKVYKGDEWIQPLELAKYFQ